jgi:lipopolysaccharide assembly protein A
MRGLVIVGIVLAILLAVFVLQNNVAVTVSLLFWSFESRLALVLLLSLAVGIITVVLVTIPANWRRRGTLSRQRKELTELQNKLEEQKQKIAALEENLAAKGGGQRM